MKTAQEFLTFKEFWGTESLYREAKVWNEKQDRATGKQVGRVWSGASCARLMKAFQQCPRTKDSGGHFTQANCLRISGDGVPDICILKKPP